MSPVKDVKGAIRIEDLEVIKWCKKLEIVFGFQDKNFDSNKHYTTKGVRGRGVTRYLHNIKKKIKNMYEDMKDSFESDLRKWLINSVRGSRRMAADDHHPTLTNTMVMLPQGGALGFNGICVFVQMLE
ncbi:hypothetical protein IEQ34_003327 [Dendrobium chrysotoxum]|uniref:Uncharacterized protein n=1 Tax=Dendrobium chrysotoxum TaxID=161865 RepID=A0AAV7HJD5_DENCH|nr:hypothetical protein IEQ34_003327 [Dendrobium chrysotoxum]